MSLHRVLPVPLALSDRGLAQRCDAVPDSLEGARIMTDRRPSTAYIHSPQASTSLPFASSSPAEARHSTSPPDSSEDYHSPSISRSIPTPKKRGEIPWEQPESCQEEEYPASICLCQPDPKVPRPRNAFILYRQHYQASVVSQNPGLANPQISKVIGDHWRTEPEEVKNHWRILAEEEKARHQKQYPGYRYQPRKSNRTNSVSSTLPVNEEANLSLTRCAKCGGRSISSAAMMSVTAAGNQQINHAHRTPTAMACSPARALTNSSNASGTSRFVRGLGSPPNTQVPPQGYRYQSKAFPLTSPHSKRPDLHEPLQHSPDAKRRRMANSVAFIPIRGPTGPSSPLSFPTHHKRRESLPRLDSLGPSSLHSPFTMGPPPRQQALGRSENSLTLAPLQQAIGNTASNAADTQAKSLEAMILSIPILNKIKVLARISAPLAASPPSSPTAPTTATASTASVAASREQTGKRGLVIAVDAADPLALKQLTRALAHALEEHDVKIIATPRPTKNTEPSFQSYLRLIDEYHTLSAEIKDHITTPALPPQPTNTPFLPPNRKRRPPTATTTTTTITTASLPPDPGSPVSPKSFPRSIPSKATQPMSDDADTDHETSRSSSISSSDIPSEPSLPTNAAASASKLPIALLPAWQLTHTDAFACSVDIADRYSPLDHWQWGATVWRGVVGADITVAVRVDVAGFGPGGGEESPVKSEAGRERERERERPGTAGGRGVGAGGAGSGGASVGGGREGGGGSSNNNMMGNGNYGGGGGGGGGAGGAQGVEIRLDDARAVVVRGDADGGGLPEGSLRRVGFEVGEWVRGWAEREERRRKG